MKLERTKNATRNIIFGVALKLYQIVLPFVTRTVMIYTIGVQYLGLNSLFTSILQVLNIAELGVGSAMVFSMYEPITKDDNKTICALMNLYKWYYRIIGGVILVFGLILLPFIPNLISGKVPSDMNVYVLYLLNLLATVFTYWLFAFRNSILQAYQRTDVTSKVTLGTDTFKYLLQVVGLCVFHNYYYYVIALLVSQILTNVITAYFSKKMYPQYDPMGKLPKSEVKKINRRIKDLFTSKLGATIVNSADTIVISAFLGLTALAIYQNYFFVITSLIALMTMVYSACLAGIGNSIIVETLEKNLNDLKRFTVLILWISTVCTSCLLCLYQPFIAFWVGKDLQMEYAIVICICIYFFIYEINHLLNVYKDAAGLWHKDRFRPLVTALSNLAMNIIMVQFWGLYGVVLSTVISMCVVGMPWLIHNLFTVLFKKEHMVDYLKLLFTFAIVGGIICAVTTIVCNLITFNSNLITLVVRGIVCVVISNVLFIAVFRKNKRFGEAIYLIEKMFKGKLPLHKVLSKELKR